MEKIGLLLLLAGLLGLMRSLAKVARRSPRRGLPPSFDFSHYKRFEHNR